MYSADSINEIVDVLDIPPNQRKTETETKKEKTKPRKTFSFSTPEEKKNRYCFKSTEAKRNLQRAGQNDKLGAKKKQCEPDIVTSETITMKSEL